MLLGEALTSLFEIVRSSKFLSMILYSIELRMERADRLQRYMGARTKRVAMGVQIVSLVIFEGSSWYLSQMAAGMKSSPAIITKYPWRRAVLVLNLVKVDARHRGIWVIFYCFIVLISVAMSCWESCLCLKLERSSESDINKYTINSCFQYYHTNVSQDKRQCCYLPPFFSAAIKSLYNLSIFVIMAMEGEKGLSFKVILIGDSGTGKTSLIHQYIHGKFKDEYQVTVGVDFSSKIVEVEGSPVQLQIWDTCGQDIYKAITNNFYRGAAAVFLVYAIDNRQSFERLKQWLQQFYEKGSNKAFVFVIATKCDLEREVEAEEGFEFMKSVNGTFFIETSAKQSIKVEELFYKAAETMFKFYQISKDYRDLVKPERMTMSVAHQLPNSRITLTGSVLQQEKTKKKCC